MDYCVFTAPSKYTRLSSLKAKKNRRQYINRTINKANIAVYTIYLRALYKNGTNVENKWLIYSAHNDKEFIHTCIYVHLCEHILVINTTFHCTPLLIESHRKYHNPKYFQCNFYVTDNYNAIFCVQGLILVEI